MYDIIELNNKLATELKEIAKDLNIPKYESLKKQELIYKILDHQALNPSPEDLIKEKKDRTRIFRPKKKNVDESPIKKNQGFDNNIVPDLNLNKELIIDDTAVRLNEEPISPNIAEDTTELIQNIIETPIVNTTEPASEVIQNNEIKETKV